MKKIRLEMDVPEETWRKCAVQAAEAGLTFEELVKTEWFAGMIRNVMRKQVRGWRHAFL